MSQPTGPRADLIWMDGKLVPWDEANIHVMSHVIHYGSGAFEGARVYKHPKGGAMMRMPEHCRRLIESSKMLRMELKWNAEEIHAAIVKTIKANKLGACYVRPVTYRGVGPAGVNPLKNPTHMFIAVWEWGKYLGPEALTEGVDVCVSSHQRMAANTHLAMGKITGNYVNSQFAKMEAVLNGFSEGIMLNTHGMVSEGSGENIFIVRDGEIYTPHLGNSALGGITRDCVLKLAADRNLPVRQQPVSREMLYIADEIFFSGTAAEVTPVRSVDRHPVGNGKRGPITELIQADYFDILEGRAEDRHGWLEFI